MAVRQPEPAFVLSEPFQERIERLFRELRLAIKFHRPSILLAVYRSDLVRAEVDAQLARKLADLGQRIVRIRVSRTDYDVPALLADYPERENAVFFVRNLRWGENQGRETYRALNIRREYFVEEGLHVVFWLTETELRDLAIFATDFWAFRHRTVEFIDQAEPDHIERQASRLAWEAWGDGQFGDNTGDKIALREKLLAELPDTQETRYQRAELHYTLAPLYRADKNFKKALESNNLALELAILLEDQQLQASAYNNRGLTYHELGQFDNALADYARAIRLNPEDASAYNNRGNTYKQLGQFDNALADYARAIRLNPEFANAYNNRGNTYDELGQFDNALADYARAIRLNPEDAGYFNSLGSAYDDLKMPVEAEIAYKRALEIDPDHPYAHNNLASIYIENGNWEKAKYHLQKRVDLEPQTALNARVQLGIQARCAGEISDSNQYFLKALDNWDKAWEMRLQSIAGLLENKAIALLCVGEKEEAVKTLQEALKNRLPGDDFDLTSYNLLSDSSSPPDGIKEMIDLLSRTSE